MRKKIQRAFGLNEGGPGKSTEKEFLKETEIAKSSLKDDGQGQLSTLVELLYADTPYVGGFPSTRSCFRSRENGRVSLN
jgi:hypothetical protein